MAATETVSSTPSRGRRNRSNLFQSPEDVREVVKEVAQELRGQEQHEDDVPDGHSNPEPNSEPSAFDLFDDVGAPAMERGQLVQYTIKRWGQHIATKHHPYSWEKLREEFGPGQYQVIAKDDNTKQYMKKESRLLGEVRTNEKVEAHPTPAPSAGIPYQMPQMSFIEMMTFMENQAQRARQEAREASKESANSQQSMMLALLEVTKSSQMQMQTMMLEMNKMQAQVAEKLADAQQRTFEKLNERIEKIAELATSKKSDGLGLAETIKLIENSRNAGLELANQINQLAEVKTEERVALLEQAREIGGGGDDSLTNTLIKSLLPVVATAMTQQQLQAAQVQPQIAPPHHTPVPTAPQLQQRGVVQRPQTPRPRQTNQANETQGRATKAPKRDAGQPRPVVRSDGPSIRTSPVKTGPVETKVEVLGADKPEVTLETSAVKPANVMSVKDQCMEILPEFLGGLMLEGVETPIAAQKTIEYLLAHGVSAQTFLSEVRADDLIAVAKQYSLPKEAYEWLNNLYADIQTSTGNVARGEPT